jgi:hypothetical protein
MLNHGNTLVQLLHCRFLPVSSNQLFHLLHSCCCNLSRATWSGIICDFRTPLREFFDPVVNRFTRQTLPTLSRKYFFYEYPLHWVLLSTKMYNRTLLFCKTLLKHGRHFDYWNQPQNMRIRVCYLDYHGARLCCYLVIHNRKFITFIAAVLLPFVTCYRLAVVYT